MKTLIILTAFAVTISTIIRIDQNQKRQDGCSSVCASADVGAKRTL